MVVKIQWDTVSYLPLRKKIFIFVPYFLIGFLKLTRPPVTRWVKLSLNFEFLVPK